MNAVALRYVAVAVLAGLLVAGCAAPRVDLSLIARPDRAAALDAYSVFVGDWDWQAQLHNAEGADEQWTGSAHWAWTLDERCLEGHLHAQSANAEFESQGVWSWHPKKRQYIWWMFNNWGYPQQGTATYDAAERVWRMPYRSVGLDGTSSYGVYIMRVLDNDTLEWKLDEWADRLHLAKKLEMTGTYTRQR